MNLLRVGTRGSDLALRQTEWVCDRLRQAHPSITVELVIVTTEGDVRSDPSFGATWPVGAFVRAIEQALLDLRIDLAVHSLKDLQTIPTKGLAVAAVPPREVAHDVLLTRRSMRLGELPPGARIGTSSPRRAAQMRRQAPVDIVPLRGNVPTRIAKLEREGLDGIVLAAAGLKRLGIRHGHTIDLPLDRFVPAPGQGALAVQARDGSKPAALAAALDDAPTRTAVTAERSFLHAIGAGCHVPAGALATVAGGVISLRGQIFSEDGAACMEGVESGADPEELGTRLARRLAARSST